MYKIKCVKFGSAVKKFEDADSYVTTVKDFQELITTLLLCAEKNYWDSIEILEVKEISIFKTCE